MANLQSATAALRKVRVPVATGYVSPTSLSAITRDDFYQYGSNVFTFTVANENFQQTIPIQQDAHFVCVMSTFDSSLVAPYATAIVANGGSVVVWTDLSSQRSLMNVQVPINNACGTAREPYVWPMPHIFRANGGIVISITGTAGAAQTVRIVFSGYKIPVGSMPEYNL
jgi:hypothetical protein